MQNNISFKIATEADLQIIQQLAEKIWRKHYPAIITLEQIDYMLQRMYSIESLQQQLNDVCHFILEFVDENPCGFISVSEKKIGEYFIHKLYVDVEQHRSGLGRALLDEALQLFSDWKKISLTVNRQNFKAINFYFKNGFVIEQVADFDIGNGYVMNDFVMMKKRMANWQ